MFGLPKFTTVASYDVPFFAFDQVSVSFHGIGLVRGVGELGAALVDDEDDYVRDDDPLPTRMFGRILPDAREAFAPDFGLKVLGSLRPECHHQGDGGLLLLEVSVPPIRLGHRAFPQPTLFLIQWMGTP